MSGDGESVNITEDEAALYDRQIRLWGLDAQKRLKSMTGLFLFIIAHDMSFVKSSSSIQSVNARIPMFKVFVINAAITTSTVPCLIIRLMAVMRSVNGLRTF